jgi:hypothetical protein
LWYQAKWRSTEWFQKHCKIKIPMKKPLPPHLCEQYTWDENGDNEHVCGKPLHITAVDTGDGWCFSWECEDHEGENEEFITDWYPFLLGVWCNSTDLTRIGIEVA